MRLVIADDHRLFAQALRSALVAEGLDVVGIATDGAQAVELALELEPDILLLDLDMPGVDGFEAMRRLKEHESRVCVIVLTGADASSDRQRAQDLGAVGFVRKDQDLDELVGAVRTVAALAFRA